MSDPLIEIIMPGFILYIAMTMAKRVITTLKIL